MALGIVKQVALVSVFLQYWSNEILAAWLAIYAAGNLVLIVDAGLQFRAINFKSTAIAVLDNCMPNGGGSILGTRFPSGMLLPSVVSACCYSGRICCGRTALSLSTVRSPFFLRIGTALGPSILTVASEQQRSRALLLRAGALQLSDGSRSLPAIRPSSRSVPQRLWRSKPGLSLLMCAEITPEHQRSAIGLAIELSCQISADRWPRRNK